MPNTGIKSRARCKDLETMRFSPVILTRSIYTFLCSLALRVTQVNSTCALRVYMCSTCACCVCSTCALYFFTHVLNVHSTFAPLFLNNGSHREPVWIRTTWTLPSTCIYAGLQQEAALQHPACPRGRVLHVRWQEQWRKSTLKLARVYCILVADFTISVLGSSFLVQFSFFLCLSFSWHSILPGGCH